ncbi:MAG: YjjG family noncanonical pyrimidine nucleotidase [Streptococcus sp.]|nr:YjjG family noncanonical pyrimidine nucleotidase [Streptococcus sp.]
MQYKFLLFDLDHTLFDFDSAEDIALSNLLKEQGVAEIQAYKDYYVPMNKQLWRDLEDGKITKKELIQSRFSKLFAYFGIEKDGVLLAKSYQHHLSQQGQIYEGVEQLLDTLTDKQYELYAATNGIDFIQTRRLLHSGIAPYFNQVFISDRLQVQKPLPAFYDKIAKQIPNFKKEEALMIGDSLSADIAGGTKAGIDTVWYNPENTLNTTDYQPTYTVRSYNELMALLVK